MLVQIYFFVFAALTAAGGVMGFVKANSTPSLIAGVASGLLLAVAAYMIKTTPGLVVGLATSLLLLGKFLPGYLKKHTFMPAGLMTILSIVAIAITIVSLVRK